MLPIQQIINVLNQPQHIFRCLAVYYITRIIAFMHLQGNLTVSQHENKICYKQLVQQFYFLFFLSSAMRIKTNSQLTQNCWKQQRI